MPHGRLILILICILLSACTSFHMAEEFQRGKMNFESGDFKKAFHRLLPVAYSGNPKAQYAIGYMYYYGYGAPEDRESGIFWMSQAARCHYPPAIQALDLIARSQISHPCRKIVPTMKKQLDLKGEHLPLMGASNEKRTLAYEQSLRHKTLYLKSPGASTYTLQLYGSYQSDAVKQLKNKLNMKELSMAKTQFHNRDWYVLTFGKYQAPHLAKRALENLPQKAGALKPWIRKMDHLNILV